MPDRHFRVILRRTDEQPRKQMRTGARSTSPSRGSSRWSASPSRRTTAATSPSNTATSRCCTTAATEYFSKEKEFEKEYVAVGKEIKKEYVAVEKHSMHIASRQKQHLENLVPTRFRRDGPSPSGRRPSTQSIELCKRNEFAFFLLEAKGCVTNLKSNEVFVAVLSPRHQRSGRDPA